jgi:membrane protease YdiL (CAAX protease family)
MKTLKQFNWRIFFILWAASILGVMAVLPYALTLQASILTDLPMPMEILILLSIVQSAILFGLVIFIGLSLAGRVGLGLPILEAKLAGRPFAEHLKSILLPSFVVGVSAAVLIIVLEVLVFQPALQAELGNAAQALDMHSAQPPAWMGFLASFYGGINEELLLRLFLFTLFAWLGKSIQRTPESRPATIVFWIANILSALLFGLGHLPATAALIPLTPLVILRALVLNGLAGLAFGYLYWTRGLESAMLAHFTADLVLHVLLVI